MIDMEPQQQNHDPKTTTNVGRAVMTDEQLETLRKQIAVYTIISKHLFEMYKTLTATSQTQQDLALVTSGKTTMLSSTSGPGHKSKRQRWNPTTSQLQILESIFSKASGLPSKQKIREIADELSHHGLVSVTNVYNWFQNKRARSKRKNLLQTTSVSSDDDSGKKDNTGGEIQVELDKTLVSPRSEAPSCSIEELSHEINAELLHFTNSRPPEVESLFSHSSGGNNGLSNNTETES